MHRTVTLSFLLAACGLCGLSLVAQTPPENADQQVHADLNQLMRGALYPAANVVFAAQVDDPEELKKAGFSDIEVVNFDLSEYHTVCAGRFDDINEARRLVKKLKDYHKIDAYVRIGS